LRVYPYGDVESENDWLDIDRDRGIRRGSLPDESVNLVKLARSLKGVDEKRVLLSLFSSRNYVGDVEIDERAESFEMKVNREGFVENDATAELKRFVRFAVNWATVYRDYGIKLQSEERAEEARKDLETVVGTPIKRQEVVDKAAAYLRSEFKSISSELPAEQRQRVQRSVRSAIDAVLQHEASSKRELDHLRLIASTSTLLLIFSHEVKSFIGRVEAACASLETIESKLKGESATRVRRLTAELHDTKQRFVELLDMTAAVATDPTKASPVRLALAPRIEEAAKCFKLVTTGYDIHIDVSGVPTNVKAGPMLEAELYAVALNILSNSIKSVIAAGGKKRIGIEAERRKNATFVHVRDTGIGLSPEHFEDAFVPFIADPEGKLYPSLDRALNPQDSYVVGAGTGLGLSVVRDILVARNGDVRFVTPQQGWQAELEIRFP